MRALGLFLRILGGGVMILAGASTILLGATSISGIEDPSPAVDSEMRFYAVWYVVAGLFVWRGAAAPDRDRFVLRLVAVAFFIAGCARALSWVTVGRPTTVAIVLMFIELTLGPLLLLWHHRTTH